jgi:hypothetical protein
MKLNITLEKIKFVSRSSYEKNNTNVVSVIVKKERTNITKFVRN